MIQDPKRRRAYRKMRAGLFYHRDEVLSHVTFGLKRGSIKDLRTVFKKLMTWIKREYGVRVDFCRVEVWENTDSISDDDRIRIHCHMIWNAPYIQQKRIVEKFETYLGENATVFIKNITDDRRSANYLLQYMGYKQQSIKFSYSRNWLPKGYDLAWARIKCECKGDNDIIDLNPYTLALMPNPIEVMNSWIEKQCQEK